MRPSGPAEDGRTRCAVCTGLGPGGGIPAASPSALPPAGGAWGGGGPCGVPAAADVKHLFSFVKKVCCSAFRCNILLSYAKETGAWDFSSL